MSQLWDRRLAPRPSSPEVPAGAGPVGWEQRLAEDDGPPEGGPGAPAHVPSAAPLGGMVRVVAPPWRALAFDRVGLFAPTTRRKPPAGSVSPVLRAHAR